jgi:hypothetical protein
MARCGRPDPANNRIAGVYGEGLDANQQISIPEHGHWCFLLAKGKIGQLVGLLMRKRFHGL